MFLRCTKRLKDGKEHLYWSIVESRRVSPRQVVQRHVLYLGELNGRQESSWRKTIELFGQDEGTLQQVALFPEEHAPKHVGVDEFPVVQLRIQAMRLERPRQWGGLLAGLPVVGEVAPGGLLAAASAAQPRRHPLGSGAPDPRALPAH